MRGFLWFLYILFSIQAVSAQTSFSRGEELFMQNKPQEALKYLEAAAAEDPAHVQAFLYLGMAYLQLNRLDDAIAAYKKILPRGGKETAAIAFNLGNVYFLKGAYDPAIQNYTQAIGENPSYASAFLNRANALVRTGKLNEAVADYEQYLALEPGTPKREQVVKLIAFIREEFAAAERRRVVAEEAAKAAELERIKAEEAAKAAAELERIRAAEAAKAEADRRRQLLQEVTDSLQAAAEDSKGLSAGSEDVQDYSNEFELQ